ncbi:MAG: hypothetical protein A3G91_00440 [Omnitrophica WOR_2 bacterium RIFCSPLOWO2_12_FULL_50_9]|nr:MAG: hypothetical protein A3D87_00985 [Omnitrophica WOR_2 bacterium RIFCSPHIGHO2_02_FULL_50_17]OGX40548.1 MAG: hypothetical protein A3G91_00440 [Omnitrophica WOR_2 bacterium RIFCSPLOWO2_12_FULL_50_9]
MLNKKMETALNQQIIKEFYASSSYLSMASWAETKSLRGCASFFNAQSQEERGHMQKLVQYINQSGGHALVPAVQEPPAQYNSLADLFETSLKQETDVTQAVHKLVDLALTAKDYASFHFLQWYVGEQHEEENLFRTILDLIKMGGADGKNLLLVDREIGQIRQQK